MSIAIRSTESFDNDTLDQVRGVLCALANRSETYFNPVSTLSVRFALERRNRELAPANSLQLLYSIGDVQRLPGGYWLPVPTTLMPLGSSTMVISGAPNQTLEEQLGTAVRSRGYSRLVSHLPGHSSPYPQRTFASWCGAPENTAAWTTRYLNDARYSSQFIDEGIECFDHWSKRALTRWLDKSRWATIPNGIVVSRVRSPVVTFYLLCKFRASRLTAVIEIGRERSIAWRLIFGLRALANNHAWFRVRRDSETESTLFVTRFLPTEEEMALYSLGDVQEDGATLRITLDDTVVPSMVQMLSSLGLQQDVD
jgi:hypothetical protein